LLFDEVIMRYDEEYGVRLTRQSFVDIRHESE
jgi:hypothetical protein